jgi:hypothetical protein
MFEAGVTHYDDPPPDVIVGDDELEGLREDGRFRFANRLSAWIEVRDGKVVDAGYGGGGRMGLTTVSVARKSARFEPVALPDIQRPPEIRGTEVRFVQTTGGRAPLPAPRRVKHPPFFRLKPPDVWTTLSLTIRVDGSSDFEVVGASKFPRHWVFDSEGKLAAKAGLTDFKDWYRSSAGVHTPWGDEDSEALVTAVETALERQLSTTIMRGGQKPDVRNVKQGKNLVEQGQPGDELFLLLDGVLAVEVDGRPVAEVGPGAVVGERAALAGGRRTSTLRALTPVRVAVARGDQLSAEARSELDRGHRREEAAHATVDLGSGA